MRRTKRPRSYSTTEAHQRMAVVIVIGVLLVAGYVLLMVSTWR